jgi:hypothetical protein
MLGFSAGRLAPPAGAAAGEFAPARAQAPSAARRPHEQPQPQPSCSGRPPLREPARPRRAARLRARAADEAAPAAAAAPAAGLEAAPDRRRYRAFPMDGCEFLISETHEGRLDLADAFVADAAGGVPARAAAEGVPAGAAAYAVAEWAAEYAGNDLEDRAAKRWVQRVYLVRVESEDPYRLDLSAVFCADAATRALARCEVRWLAPPETPAAELRLRIRECGVTVDTVASLPGPEGVSAAARAGARATSALEAAADGADADADAGAPPGAAAAAALADEGGAEAAAAAAAEAEVLYDDDTLADFLGADDDVEVAEADDDLSDF